MLEIHLCFYKMVAHTGLCVKQKLLTTKIIAKKLQQKDGAITKWIFATACLLCDDSHLLRNFCVSFLS